jgi:hypothetical protein
MSALELVPDPAPKPTHRGTTNGNERGNSTVRRARREWLVATYRADRDLLTTGLALILGEPIEVPIGHGEPACRCYRCSRLLTADTVTADRIKAGVDGGKYRTPRMDNREGVTNIRPACGTCNSQTGQALSMQRRKRPERKHR